MEDHKNNKHSSASEHGKSATHCGCNGNLEKCTCCETHCKSKSNSKHEKTSQGHKSFWQKLTGK